jgi:hypothetical protein
LIVAVAVEEVSVVVSGVGARGLPASTTSCGLDNVSVALVYVPVGTLVKLRGTVNSIRQAKSTVTGELDDTTATGEPLSCGVRVAPVMVTVKDTTSQTGVSPVKTTAEPRLLG